MTDFEGQKKRQEMVKVAERIREYQGLRDSAERPKDRNRYSLIVRGLKELIRDWER